MLTIFCGLWLLIAGIEFLHPTMVPLCHINEIQSMLLTASSIIFALMGTFVISKYFGIQKYRLSYLDKFLELQISLIKYQKALFYLGDQLERRYSLYPAEYNNWQKLMEDGAFKNDSTKKPFSRIFVLCLKDFGKISLSYSDTDLQRKIMGKNELESSKTSIEFLRGFLTNPDFFRELFSELRISTYSYDFQRIPIADDSWGLKEYASKIAQETDRDDSWEYLDFWETRVTEASTIVKKMLDYTAILHDYKAEVMKKLMFLLLGLSIFGILLPMILLGFIFNSIFEGYLTYISLIGFLGIFVLIILLLYDELTSTDICRL